MQLGTQESKNIVNNFMTKMSHFRVLFPSDEGHKSSGNRP